MKHFPTAQFSVFTEDKTEYQDLDAIAFEGICILHGKSYPYWGGDMGKDYFSEVLSYPTWGEVFIHAMKCQQCTLDFHHSFLEGLRSVGAKNGITILEFELGS